MSRLYRVVGIAGLGAALALSAGGCSSKSLPRSTPTLEELVTETATSAATATATASPTSFPEAKLVTAAQLRAAPQDSGIIAPVLDYQGQPVDLFELPGISSALNVYNGEIGFKAPMDTALVMPFNGYMQVIFSQNPSALGDRGVIFQFDDGKNLIGYMITYGAKTNLEPHKTYSFERGVEYATIAGRFPANLGLGDITVLMGMGDAKGSHPYDLLDPSKWFSQSVGARINASLPQP